MTASCSAGTTPATSAANGTCPAGRRCPAKPSPLHSAASWPATTGWTPPRFRTYLGSYDRVHDSQVIRTFVFTASCADPLQICRNARIAHCWADPANLPEQASQELARITDLATQAAPAGAPPGRWQLTAALRACSKGMYCDQAATELLIRHGTWLRRDDFTARFILTGTGPADDITAAINWDEAITALMPATCRARAAKPPSSTFPPPRHRTSPVTLRHAITGLDQANLHLVLNAQSGTPADRD